VGKALLVVAATLLMVTASAQEKPLPNRQRLFEETRGNLERSQARQASFSYLERRRELHTNPFGKLGSGTGTEEYRVEPQPDGGTARTLIARDGVPVKGAPTTRRGPRPRTSRRSAVADTAEALELTLDRREKLGGRDVIVVTFAPRPDAEPETREGKLASNFRGRIFVDEAEAEVIRVEATAIENISYGLGVVARLNKGATVTLVRERVEGDTWLPTSIKFAGEGRAMLFRKLHVDHVIEWLDYKRVVRTRVE
jgi:hypothetical protein